MKKETYKGWEIVKGDYGYYEAWSLKDCDESMIFSKTVDGIKEELNDKIENKK